MCQVLVDPWNHVQNVGNVRHDDLHCDGDPHRHPARRTCPAVASPRRPISRRRKLLLALVPVTALLAAAEFAAQRFRAGRGHVPQGTHSYRDHRIDLIRRAFPSEHHQVLGFVPKAGYAGRDNVWGTQVTILPTGLRSNGPAALPLDRRGVLAVGDSFTFGDQVSDGDTWPAQLERLLGRPVRNGGVFGYGFDQTVLRAERLLLVDELDVDTVVVSLVPDDLKRAELSRRYSPKPWFAMVGDGLELRGVPVPDTGRDNDMDRQWLRKAMGYSALLDTLFWNAAPRWWVQQEREVRVHEEGSGLELGRRLVDRLLGVCRERGVRMVLVLQGQRPEMAAGTPVRAPELVVHAGQRGIEALDLASEFAAMVAEDPTLDSRWFAGHMTPEGNRWVAQRVADVLAAAKTRPR